MADLASTHPPGDSAPPEVAELELTDADILDAMQHIPGYLDISTEDFRTLYHLAHRHAVERLFGKLTAGKLMRTGISPLSPEMSLASAARVLAQSGAKSLPVVDDAGRVIGMLTETDFLRRLKADTFLELLLRMLDGGYEFQHRCHETPVSAAMTVPAVTVAAQADFTEAVAAFQRHNGRTMPVVDEAGQLLGLLLRKDFFDVFHLEQRP